MTAQKRISKPEPPAKPELAMPFTKAAEKIQERIALGMELEKRKADTIEKVENKLKDYEKWNDYNKELLNAMFTTPKLAQDYSNAYSSDSVRVRVGGPPSTMEKLEARMENLKIKIQTLESILERLELFSLAPGIETSQPIPEEQRELRNKVFIVHGQDEGAKQGARSFP